MLIQATFESGRHSEQLGKRAGFSLHAGVACKASQRKKLERLCRYITRPAIAEQRLSLASNGNVVVRLKTPYADGTTHIVLSPMEFIGRLVSLVPRPRTNPSDVMECSPLTSKLRKRVVPEKSVQEKTAGKAKRYGMCWAQRLKRVFSGAAIR